MLHREREQPPDYVYPAHEWKIVEKRFYPRYLAQSETFFSTGNGYLGMRGNFDEGDPVVQSGTFINGFHETWPIVYGEEAHGFAKTGQTMLNVTNSKIIKLYVKQEEVIYLLRQGSELVIKHRNREIKLSVGVPVAKGLE